MKYIYILCLALFYWFGFSAPAGYAAGVPVASNPPLYKQEKLRAVDHWDNVADAVATRLVKIYQKRDDLIARPVYVTAPNDRPFSIAFASLLRTRLVTKGMQVSHTKEPDSLILEYDIQTVLHDSSRTSWLPTLSDMGIAIIGGITGEYTSRSDHEIIINTRVVDNNRYVMHLSTVCYINDADWPHYISPQSLDPQSDKTRTIRVINRY